MALRSSGTGNLCTVVLKQLSDRKPAEAVVTTDVGQHQMWTAQHMQFARPENFITSSGLGTMGFGIPAAVGAQMARPDDMVICVSGDGSFMMNVQELGTIKRKNLPVKIILLDNQRLGMVRQWQQLFLMVATAKPICQITPISSCWPARLEFLVRLSPVKIKSTRHWIRC